MTDRPNLSELLDAVRMHLETAVIPAIRTEPHIYFQTLVALNLLKIAQRELLSGAQMLRIEWEGVNHLTGVRLAAPDRDSELEEGLKNRYRLLREDIRAGSYDDGEKSSQLDSFLEVVVGAQLIMNNPPLARRMSEELSKNEFPE